MWNINSFWKHWFWLQNNKKFDFWISKTLRKKINKTFKITCNFVKHSKRIKLFKIVQKKRSSIFFKRFSHLAGNQSYITVKPPRNCACVNLSKRAHIFLFSRSQFKNDFLCFFFLNIFCKSSRLFFLFNPFVL